ncbi:ubiquitin carboxyl-terminal hydrolase 5/13 [Fistulifera solaris]|uniref:Ubiquitin carboxyl-terminal hydrolase n=1 Tax=Fistulifera solaris TaxID=1519565 RepID=A0A1Z5KEY9_FISSO|nr:ubiquitin carboxyl-terminal hydrolase 5/13 [Fistulifera solaris]|eukprot:GAX24776.1 ubiquitin carboxyl-terminal hydrolase 5/13 [Fistulifera solaris]
MEAVCNLAGTCRIAAASDRVLNTECAYTFHTPLRGGIYVSCVDFIGVHRPKVPGLYVKITQTSKRKDLEQNKNAKATKLAINVEGGFDTERYEIVSQYAVAVIDEDCNFAAELPFNDETKNTFPPRVVQSVESILHHTTLTTQQEVTQWELEAEPIPVSKYAADLPFVHNGITISPHPSDWKCQKDGSTANLWLNLSDGYIGGGRKNWDGSGGSNGALDHYEETGRKYPLVVKLGTISQESADCYSYAPDEDGPVKVPNLAELLSKRGIQVGTLQKTVKSTAEMEVELNATYAFDAITEEGAHLQPVALPGLQNLGNSCYLNSVVQMLFSIPELAHRYGPTAHDALCHGVAPKDAVSNVLVQTTRLASALTGETFTKPLEVDAEDPRYRLAPRLFKHCIGKEHVDFSTGQQQDAAHFLQYYLELLDRTELSHTATTSKTLQPCASHLFAFATEQRRVCTADQTIKYSTSVAPETVLTLRIPMENAVVREDEEASITETPKSPDMKRMKKDGDDEEPIPSISMSAIVASWAAESIVSDLRWKHLGDQVHAAHETVRLENFPRYLLIQLQRYTLGPDWQPIKLKVKVENADSILDLTPYRAKGAQPGETLVPDEPEEGNAADASVSIDEGALSQLMDMGFSMNSCKRALHAVGGSDVEAAMGWVFEHNNDPDFNDPLPEDATNTGGVGVDDAVVESLVTSLGCFTTDQVRAALNECGGAADRAADWLFSHMDDLDSAIKGLKNAQSVDAPKLPLEDGEGKYKLRGMISHIGKHTGSGHYVAHLLRDEKWIIFNDEKVAESAEPPFPHAYLYLYQRVDTIDKPHSGY